MVSPKELLHFQLINLGELRHRTLSYLKGDYSYRMFS